MSATRPPQELRLERVSRRFGATIALDETTLDIPAGELVALLGPSGCGKTTTLRIIAGFEKPDTGRVLVGGRDISHLPPNRRKLGMVFQDYSLFPHMSVTDNVGFGLRMASVPKDEAARRISDALNLVRLGSLGDRFPHQLSGGQQQRIALARSLITNPSLLLLDEPLGALDKNLRESMQFELRRLQQSLGITTVMVTHDQEEALTLSDRIAVMNFGRILQVGSPRDVYDEPRTRFVSEFLGTANLFAGRVAEVNGRLLLVASKPESASHFAITLPKTCKYPSGTDIEVAVRPEKMRLLEHPDERFNTCAATVTGHVFRGSYHAFEAELEGAWGQVFVHQQAQGHGAEAVPERGDRRWVSWAQEDTIVLQEETKR